MGCASSTQTDSAIQQLSRKAQCALYLSKALAHHKFYGGDTTGYEIGDVDGTPLERTKEIFLKVLDMSGIKTSDDIHLTDAEYEEPEVTLKDCLLGEDKPKQSTLAWPRDGKKHQFEYKPPNPTQGEEIAIWPLITTGTKRKIYSISDTHIGSSWGEGMDPSLGEYLDKILSIAREEILAVVLLGDILEGWLQPFSVVPETGQDRFDRWNIPSGMKLREVVRELTDEHDVEVFYVRGNHDHEVSKADIQTLLGANVKFIPGQLVIEIRSDSNSQSVYRAKFSHGHEWDIFNHYGLGDTDQLIMGLPIGYYLSRAVATSQNRDGDRKCTDVESTLISFLRTVLRFVPSTLEDDLVSVLSTPIFQRKVTERILLEALGVDSIHDAAHLRIKVSETEHLTVKSLLNYPFFKYTSDQLSEKTVFHMIKAAIGDYSGVIGGVDEDIVIFAHTHEWKLESVTNDRGNQIICANTGAWTGCTKEVSAVILTPPTDDADGLVEVEVSPNSAYHGLTN